MSLRVRQCLSRGGTTAYGDANGAVRTAQITPGQCSGYPGQLFRHMSPTAHINFPREEVVHFEIARALGSHGYGALWSSFQACKAIAVVPVNDGLQTDRGNS
ncbi:hypothetical protein D9M68_550100 [compost metagenome]